MLDRLFGRRPPRIFLPPGRLMAPEVLERHRDQHMALAGETLAGHTDHFAIFSDGTPDGDAAAAAMLQAAEADYAVAAGWVQNIVSPRPPLPGYVDPDAGGGYHLSFSRTDIHLAA